MTEKRFNVIDKCNEDRICMEISDDKGRRYRFVDIVDLLNTQHETIKRLKAYLLRYKGVIYEDLEDICNDETLSEWWEDLE